MPRWPDARVLALVLLACASLTPAAHAQQQTIRGERIAAVQGLGPPAGAVTGTGVITGRVLDAASGRPIVGAIVRAGRPTPTATPLLIEPGGPPPIGDAVYTNGSGAYVLRDLAKGAYTVSVQAPGYINGAHGQQLPEGPNRPVTLEDDGRVLNADVRLWRTAGISGVITDETGEPVVGTEVRVLRRTFSGGRIALAPAGGSTTSDDRGEYRLGALIPGDYIVVVPAASLTLPGTLIDTFRDAQAAGLQDVITNISREVLGTGGAFASPMAAGVRVGDQQMQMRSASAPIGPDPTLSGEVLAYRTAYHPAAMLSSQAVALTLESGEERSGADVRLELVPTARVSGIVTGPDGPVPNMPLRLLPPGIEDVVSDAGLDAATTVTDAQGRFTFLGVPPGEYVLGALRVPRPAFAAASAASSVINIGGGTRVIYMSSASGLPDAPDEPTLWAEMPVSVVRGDVSDLTVTLRPGARMSGQVVFDGAAPPPGPEQLQRMAITLRPAGGPSGPQPLPARLDDEHRFTTGQFRPGRYILAIPAPAPWTLGSVTVEGRDVTGHPIDLAAVDLEQVVVTLTDRPASLSGSVRGTGTNRPAGATVAVFPSDLQDWVARGMADARTHSAVVGQNGTFTMPNLLAGDYLAVAIDADTAVDLRDPATYERLARAGTRITIAHGAQATVALPLNSFR